MKNICKFLIVSTNHPNSSTKNHQDGVTYRSITKQYLTSLTATMTDRSQPSPVVVRIRFSHPHPKIVALDISLIFHRPEGKTVASTLVLPHSYATWSKCNKSQVLCWPSCGRWNRLFSFGSSRGGSFLNKTSTNPIKCNNNKWYVHLKLSIVAENSSKIGWTEEGCRSLFLWQWTWYWIFVGVV